jgi:hypothetical protein
MHMKTTHVIASSAALIGLAVSLFASDFDVSRGVEKFKKSFSVTAEDVVRIQTLSGATAVVQFTKFGTGNASYRWRYYSAKSQPIKIGTGQVRESYKSKPNADGSYSPAPDDNETVRAGDILIEWSSGGTGTAWLYYNTNSATIQILSSDAFEKDF